MNELPKLNIADLKKCVVAYLKCKKVLALISGYFQ